MLKLNTSIKDRDLLQMSVMKALYRDVQVRIYGNNDGKLRIDECLSTRLCSKLEEYGKLRDGYIDPYEAGFLVYKGVAEFNGKTGEEAFEKIIGFIDDFLMFQVYLDLRKRGKRVSRGPRRRSLLLIEGSHVYEVHVMSEGEIITPRELAELSKYSLANARTPIAAIVDSTGIITYYSMAKSDIIK